MTIKRGHSGGLYIAFRDEDSAEKWAWLFHIILRMRWSCVGGFLNGFEIIPNGAGKP